MVPNIDRKTLVFKIFLIAGDDGNSDCSLHDQIKFLRILPKSDSSYLLFSSLFRRYL